MAKVEEIQARSVDRVFDSKDKAEGQQMNEILPNLSGFDHTIEEWEIE